MSSQFETFRQLLLTAVQDPTFVKANTLMQQTTFRAEIVSRINAMSGDQNVMLDVANVSASSGGLSANPGNNTIDFNPAGFRIVLSNDDGSVTAPARTWRRAVVDATPADGIRYLVCDTTRGVLQLGADCVVHSIFPGAGQQAVSGYDAPTAAITFTIAAVEYVAIAMPTHHVVRIYEYATGLMVASIGTLDAAGVTSATLTAPTDLAFRVSTNELFIMCASGQPAGAITPTGYITRFDLTVPAKPVFVDVYAKTSTNGSLTRLEVDAPTAIFVDGNNLWVANGTPTEIGCIDLASDTSTLVFNAASFPSRPFASVGCLRVKQINSTKYLYIFNGAYGSVLVLSLATNTVVNAFTFAAQTSHLLTYGLYGDVTAGEPDAVEVDGVVQQVVVATDLTNQRVVLLDEQVYLTTSQCVFNPSTFSVPVRLRGFSVAGTISPELVLVEYKPSSTATSWRRLDAVADVNPSTYFAFRLTLRLPMGYPLDSGVIQRLIILAEQV